MSRPCRASRAAADRASGRPFVVGVARLAYRSGRSSPAGRSPARSPGMSRSRNPGSRRSWPRVSTEGQALARTVLSWCSIWTPGRDRSEDAGQTASVRGEKATRIGRLPLWKGPIASRWRCRDGRVALGPLGGTSVTRSGSSGDRDALRPLSTAGGDPRGHGRRSPAPPSPMPFARAHRHDDAGKRRSWSPPRPRTAPAVADHRATERSSLGGRSSAAVAATGVAPAAAHATTTAPPRRGSPAPRRTPVAGSRSTAWAPPKKTLGARKRTRSRSPSSSTGTPGSA